VTIRIAIDAMGGDLAPQEVVAGVLMAIGTLGADLLLVGQPESIRQELRGTGDLDSLEIIEAPEVIEMDDHPTEAVKAKPRSSINVGLRLVKEGRADAFVTAGNTGATMAAALLTLGRVKGIGRPALGLVYALPRGGEAMLIDVGANADCRPVHLLQFGHMGSAYMAGMFDRQAPKVALLSIGEEATKGNQLTIEAHDLLRRSSLAFVGNVEGKDLLRGVADVIVADGFTGNVVLKTVEGVSEMLFAEVRHAVELTPWNKIAGRILYSELRRLRRRLDYAEYGGVQLLGVDGVVVIGHGRSNARAIFNAIRAARDAVRNGVLERIRETAAANPAKVTEGDEGGGRDP
jgi:glycerol-3-phosphate acyltransferase PlsX